MRRRVRKERETDPTPLTMGETIQKYLARHPRFVSDVAYFVELRNGRGGAAL